MQRATTSVHLTNCASSSVTSVLFVSEQEVWFRCRMRLVNQTLRYHKQMWGRHEGRREKRKRLATLSTLQRESLPGFCSYFRVCFHFHGNQSQKPTNTFFTAMKSFTRRAGRTHHLIRLPVKTIWDVLLESNWLMPFKV